MVDVIKVETFKEQLFPDCDLTYTALAHAHSLFIKKYGFQPQGISVSIEALPSALTMRIGMPYKEWFIACDRDYPKFYWQIEGYQKGNQHIVYSNGA